MNPSSLYLQGTPASLSHPWLWYGNGDTKELRYLSKSLIKFLQVSKKDLQNLEESIIWLPLSFFFFLKSLLHRFPDPAPCVCFCMCSRYLMVISNLSELRESLFGGRVGCSVQALVLSSVPGLYLLNARSPSSSHDYEKCL